MPAKKKTSAKISTPKAKISKEIKEEIVEEKSLSLSTLKNSLNKSGRTKWVVLTILITALILFLGNKYFVAAWVNKKPITKFELSSALEKRYGKDLLEELIVEKLIEDEARKRAVSISQEEIEGEIKKVEDQQGGKDKLDQILKAQSISQDDFNKLVRLQLLRQKMFGAGKDVTEDELKKYVEENKDNLSLESRTASEEAKLMESIKEQLKNQKINQEFNGWLNGVLTGPEVSRQI